MAWVAHKVRSVINETSAQQEKAPNIFQPDLWRSMSFPPKYDGTDAEDDFYVSTDQLHF